jgi:hypothetical protein
MTSLKKLFSSKADEEKYIKFVHSGIYLMWKETEEEGNS